MWHYRAAVCFLTLADFLSVCPGAAEVRRCRSGGPSSHHEGQLVSGSPHYRRRHHVSLLQPVEGVPREPGQHGAGPQINSFPISPGEGGTPR